MSSEYLPFHWSWGKSFFFYENNSSETQQIRRVASIIHLIYSWTHSLFKLIIEVLYEVFCNSKEKSDPSETFLFWRSLVWRLWRQIKTLCLKWPNELQMPYRGLTAQHLIIVYLKHHCYWFREIICLFTETRREPALVPHYPTYQHRQRVAYHHGNGCSERNYDQVTKWVV